MKDQGGEKEEMTFAAVPPSPPSPPIVTQLSPIIIRCHPEDLITFAAAPPSSPSPPRPTC